MQQGTGGVRKPSPNKKKRDLMILSGYFYPRMLIDNPNPQDEIIIIQDKDYSLVKKLILKGMDIY